MASLHLPKNGNSRRKIPRVGDEFQAKLPTLSAEPNLVNAKYREDYRHNLFVRLPVQDCREHWNDAEKDSFLLGLYIFERNFVEVRRFVESKKMETVLSYYYGAFYGSTKYRRWSDGRKSEKCVYGQSIFSGWRQQEILSRILPSVPKNRRAALLKVSKKFEGEKISLPDYVSVVKNMVGIEKLVEAVGIGMGERDLTLEHPKSNQSIPLHPEIPTGKSCHSLTTSEIIKVLNGNYRLSKARSNHLFWEAVWPRLLARGWNSEKLSGIKNSLVFLAPGVNKFSRRELMKGVQYFDSVIEVLGRVAKEPGLIELNAGEKKRKEVDSNDDGNLSSRHRHCYLQPRTSNRSANAVEFTGSGIIELRTLPVETLNSSKNLPSQTGSYQEKLSPSSSSIKGIPKESVGCAPYVSINASGSSCGNEFKLLIDLNMPYVCPEPQNQTSEQNDHHPPNSSAIGAGSEQQDTQHSLPSSSPTEVSHSTRYCSQATRALEAVANESPMCIDLNLPQVSPELENQILEQSYVAGPSRGNESPMWIDLNLPQVSLELENQIPEKNYVAGPSRGNESRMWIDLNLPQISPELEIQIPKQNSVAGRPSRGNESPLLIDLNLPQVSPELECQILEQNDPHLPNSSAMEAGLEQQVTEARLEQQPIVNSRRHSTRSRPPTARVLEALVNGDLTVNRRRKSKEGSSRDETAPRPLQRARLA